MKVFIDLETIPDQSEGAIDKIAETLTVKAPDITKPKLIEALSLGDQGKFKTVAELKEMWLEEFGKTAKVEQATDKWLKTSFDGGRGQICSASFSFGSEVINLNDEHMSEEEMLLSFWRSIVKAIRSNPAYFVAHNAKFDLPFLWHRCVINAVPISNYFDPHGRNGKDHYCTSLSWAGHGNRISLKNLCDILGVKGKTEGMDGSQVWPEYQKGNIKKIAEYNDDDVYALMAVYNRMNFI